MDGRDNPLALILLAKRSDIPIVTVIRHFSGLGRRANVLYMLKHTQNTACLYRDKMKP